MYGNAGKCTEMPGNERKCRETNGNAGKRTEMRGNERKCREMNR